MPLPADLAVVGGRLFTGLEELSGDLGVLDARGTWVVVLPFDGPPLCARFGTVEPAPRGPAGVAPASGWSGPAPSSWTSSLDREAYVKAVTVVREAIAAGDVYQVNVCRRLSAPLPGAVDVAALGAALAAANPAPHGALVRLPSAGVAVASASPECFLRRRGPVVESRPIKGTAPVGRAFTGKDRAENVMIVDLVRNDLGRVCEYGSVQVAGLCVAERHPGLVHLASTVRGRLRRGVGWAGLLDAAFPPGSVTGAPKRAALGMVTGLEPVRRGPYCGSIGWVDADRRLGELNVAIRTFWVEGGALHLGTGAGIVWESRPDAEWEETELKARRLLGVASRTVAA
ncbi:MAG TPA: chorismate-binding protein [Acidimicrobiales bacterium]|nr:chorismate-binding protein [Acidimicrobiales bacterium]